MHSQPRLRGERTQLLQWDSPEVRRLPLNTFSSDTAASTDCKAPQRCAQERVSRQKQGLRWERSRGSSDSHLRQHSFCQTGEEASPQQIRFMDGRQGRSSHPAKSDEAEEAGRRLSRRSALWPTCMPTITTHSHTVAPALPCRYAGSSGAAAAMLLALLLQQSAFFLCCRSQSASASRKMHPAGCRCMCGVSSVGRPAAGGCCLASFFARTPLAHRGRDEE